MREDQHTTSRASYVAVWVFALAFGWTEAATVVYLRATSPTVPVSAVGAQFPFVLLADRLLMSEIVREACTILILAAVAWLSARSWRARVGAFLLAFGIWDLTYYVALRVMTGWPAALTNPDILFLIPRPWVGPVWAPSLIAGVFLVAGSYLYWTPDRVRRYTLRDRAILGISAAAIIASFLVEWSAVLATQPPQAFRPWLYWIALGVSVTWFVRVERGEVL
jgi:hypothetical protein